MQSEGESWPSYLHKGEKRGKGKRSLAILYVYGRKERKRPPGKGGSRKKHKVLQRGGGEKRGGEMVLRKRAFIFSVLAR